MSRLSTLTPRLSTLDTRTVRPEPKRADAELLTPEHRAWSYEVKIRAGWKCQWPDCGARGGIGGIRLYADHIVERADGSALLDPKNGQALCPKHHRLKTARAQRMAQPA